MHDPVNHPTHYTSHPSGIECIEVTRHLNFNRGNAIKYIWRAGSKDAAKELQDLQKAIFYLQDECQRLAKIAKGASPLHEELRPLEVIEPAKNKVHHFHFDHLNDAPHVANSID